MFYYSTVVALSVCALSYNLPISLLGFFNIKLGNIFSALMGFFVSFSQLDLNSLIG